MGAGSAKFHTDPGWPRTGIRSLHAAPARVFVGVATGHFIRVYADNVIVLARTRAKARWIEQVLVNAFWRSPAGCLRLTTSVRRLADGVTFLGYTYKRRRGVVTVEPSRENRVKFDRRYWLDMIERRQRGRRLSLRKLKMDIRSWCASFPLWGDRRLGGRRSRRAPFTPRKPRSGYADGAYIPPGDCPMNELTTPTVTEFAYNDLQRGVILNAIRPLLRPLAFRPSRAISAWAFCSIVRIGANSR